MTLKTQCPCLAGKRVLFALSLIVVVVVTNVAINQPLSSHTSNKHIRSLFSWSFFNGRGIKDGHGSQHEKGSIEGEAMNLSNTTLPKCEFSPMGAEMEFLKYLPVGLPDDYSKPMEVILKDDWVCDLQTFLSTVDPDTRLVNMIAANSNFTEPLINWLIGSHLRLEEPMKDVIVISLDPPLHELLVSRDFPSLLISPSSVMYTEDFPEVYHEHNGFYQTRMMVMRLINHWGYNTANYDTDALILRNPQIFYDDDSYAHFDIIAGFAISFPMVLHKKWGATLCNGAWMVRSNPRTGKSNGV